MKSLTPLRRHSIRRPLIGLSAERGTLRRRPKFILTAWGLVRVSLFDENVSRNKQWQPFEPKASALAGIIAKLVRLNTLGRFNSADQSLCVAVHDWILDTNLGDVSIQAEFEKRSSRTHCRPSRFVPAVSLLSPEIEPQHAAIAEKTAFWVSDEQIPESLLQQQIAQVSLVMERAAIIGRDEIATPSIMAALAEGFPHDARPLTSHEDAHALPSFPFFPSDLRCPGAASAERSVTVRCKHPLAIG